MSQHNENQIDELKVGFAPQEIDAKYWRLIFQIFFHVLVMMALVWNYLLFQIASRRAFSTVVLSFFHKKENLALKPPESIIKRELDDAVVFKMPSKFDKKSSNSGVFWLGDL